MASSSSPPLLNLTDITFDSVTCDSYEAPFSDKSRSNSSRMLISPLSKMSDGLLKQKRSRNSNLGRAKSFLSIFHRNRENGAFPTADNGKRGTKQVRTVILAGFICFPMKLFICDDLIPHLSLNFFTGSLLDVQEGINYSLHHPAITSFS